jgi:hypothetical protein
MNKLTGLVFWIAAMLAASAAEPIRLHPKNLHYFLEFRGKAVALVASAEHYGAVINGTLDYRRYLDALAADGLNYTRIFGGSYMEVPGQSFGIRRNDLAPEPGKFIGLGTIAATSSTWRCGTQRSSSATAIFSRKRASGASWWR